VDFSAPDGPNKEGKRNCTGQELAYLFRQAEGREKEAMITPEGKRKEYRPPTIPKGAGNAEKEKNKKPAALSLNKKKTRVLDSLQGPKWGGGTVRLDVIFPERKGEKKGDHGSV